MFGQVVERHWYDRNKHIFPASRWEVRPVIGCIRAAAPLTCTPPWRRQLTRCAPPACLQVYDPKKDYGGYTIYG